LKQQIQFEVGGTLRFQPTLDGKPISVGSESDPIVTVSRADGTALPEAISEALATREADGSVSIGVSAAAVTLPGPEANLIADWTYSYDGQTIRRRDLFDVVRFPLYSTVSDDDIKREMGKLTTILFPNADMTFADTINLAFEEIYAGLEAMGNRPSLVMESEQLKLAHSAKCMARIYSDQSGAPDDIWSARAKREQARYETLMDELPYRYDTNDSGTITQSEEGTNWGTSTIVRT